MALQSSGAISLLDIQTEFGGASPISISEYYGAATGIPSSGTIAMDDFYGTSAASPIVATGGTISTSGSYKYHTFTSSGTFSVTAVATGSASNQLQVLVVGGGGPGGMVGGGGGSAGAAATANYVAAVQGYTVTVGGGGAGRILYLNSNPGWTPNGVASGFHTTTAGGGQSGGSRFGVTVAGTNGVYNGGTGAYTNNPDTNRGGGGAGAGGNGNNFTANPNAQGGPGYAWLNGTTYGGGGGGGVFQTGGNLGAGGSGGGGSGGKNTSPVATSATFYGSGGGAQGWVEDHYSGSGYQGIVIVRYQI